MIATNDSNQIYELFLYLNLLKKIKFNPVILEFLSENINYCIVFYKQIENIVFCFFFEVPLFGQNGYFNPKLISTDLPITLISVNILISFSV